MGSWGSGVFDSDVAQDFLLDVERGGAATVTEWMSDYAETLDDGTFDWSDASAALAPGFLVAAAHGEWPSPNGDVARLIERKRGFLRRRTIGAEIRAEVEVPPAAGLARAARDAYATESFAEALSDASQQSAYVASAESVVAALDRIEAKG